MKKLLIGACYLAVLIASLHWVRTAAISNVLFIWMLLAWSVAILGFRGTILFTGETYAAKNIALCKKINRIHSYAFLIMGFACILVWYLMRETGSTEWLFLLFLYIVIYFIWAMYSGYKLRKSIAATDIEK